MRPVLIVIATPSGDLPPCIEQIAEPTNIQALVPKLPIEAFDVPVLHRSSGLNMHEVRLCRSMHQARKCRLVSSGQLSQRMLCGISTLAEIHSSTRVTRRLAKLVSTSSAKHSRVKYPRLRARGQCGQLPARRHKVQDQC